jgi:hypothetical protein
MKLVVGVQSTALGLTIKTAEPNSRVAFEDPCCNLKPRERENVAHLEDRLSQQLAYMPGAERADSALFEAGPFLLLGCTTIIASSVILVTVSVIKRGFDNRTE